MTALPVSRRREPVFIQVRCVSMQVRMRRQETGYCTTAMREEGNMSNRTPVEGYHGALLFQKVLVAFILAGYLGQSGQQ